MTASAPTIVVTAAVVRRGDTYLVTRRPAGVHLAGYWEFPGGKCEPEETHEACLRRELREELGVELRMGEKILEAAHAYPERTIELHFFECDLLGEPTPRLGQDMRWVPLGELDALEFPPADAELLLILQGRADSA